MPLRYWIGLAVSCWAEIKFVNIKTLAITRKHIILIAYSFYLALWETQTLDRDFYGQKKKNNSLPPRELCFTILFITNVNKKLVISIVDG